MTKTTSVKTQAFEGVFVSILLIAVFAITFGVLSLGGATIDLNPSSRDAFKHLNERPDYSALVFDEIPSAKNALIDYAVNLYNTGGISARDSDALAAYCSCLMKMTVMNVENYIDIDAAVLKSQDEYFRVDYRLERDLPFLATMKKLKIDAESFEMLLAERTYANNDMEYLAYQKVRNSLRDENGVPSADWNAAIIEEERALPSYNRTQTGIFEVVQYNVTAETVSSATVDFVESEDGNYYSVSLVLDTSNPTLAERMVESIRNGSGDEGADYTDVTMKFELWDNGYFKSLSFDETWAAKALGISFLKFETSSSYFWEFSYSSEDANLSAYADCVYMKESLEEKGII